MTGDDDTITLADAAAHFGLSARLATVREQTLETLRRCREMVDHPDNVAFIDQAIRSQRSEAG